jgi:small nuclear ribonucleoprotein (snRNP)-like protein
MAWHAPLPLFSGRVVELIMDKCQAGPLSTLHRCRGKRVRVVTRHARGVRGACVGHLAAFDKYMNLVLRVRAHVSPPMIPGCKARTKLTRKPRSHVPPHMGPDST